MPFKYRLFVWRRAMAVGYNEAMATPAHIIEQDLQMISLENKYSQLPKSDNIKEVKHKR